MEQKYKIELDFAELNILLSHCIHETRDKIARLRKSWAEDTEFSVKDFDENYAYTVDALNRLEKDVEQQLFDQGQTTLGRDHLNRINDILNA